MKEKSAKRIRIGMQKSGRLADESFALLKKCGVKIRRNKTGLFYHSENFPLDILLLRDDDIPSLVAEGMCDLGIVGQNVVAEKSPDLADTGGIQSVCPLEFGFCRLSIAGPKDFVIDDPQALVGKSIATSYPTLLSQYLDEHKIEAKVCLLSGSVEIAPGLGIADLVCDLVSTGATLEAHGLKELSCIFASQAVLIKTNQQLSEVQAELINRLKTRITSVSLANEGKYIMLHAPRTGVKNIVNLLPGTEHPTLIPLEGCPDTVAIHAVCYESVFWETLEALKAAGASAILVLPIEKMMA